MKRIKCSFCSTELELDKYHLHDKDLDLSKAITYGGAINWFTCGYGSKFDGEQLLLAICDVCLKKADILDRKEYLFNRRKDD